MGLCFVATFLFFTFSAVTFLWLNETFYDSIFILILLYIIVLYFFLGSIIFILITYHNLLVLS